MAFPVSDAPKTREARMRRVAGRQGMRVLRITADPLHPNLGMRFLVLDQRTVTVPSPTLDLDGLDEWLHLPMTARALVPAR